MTATYPRVGGRDGYLHDLPDGGHLRVEPNDTFYALSWPTLLTARTSFEKVVALGAGNPESGSIAYHSRHGIEDIDGHHLRQALTQSPDADDITFFSAEFAYFTLSWRGDVHAGTGIVHRGEIAVSSDVADPDAWRLLMLATATPNVGAHAAELTELTSDEVQRFKHGTVLPQYDPKADNGGED